jgi:hypothetical protein
MSSVVQSCVRQSSSGVAITEPDNRTYSDRTGAGGSCRGCPAPAPPPFGFCVISDSPPHTVSLGFGIEGFSYFRYFLQAGRFNRRRLVSTGSHRPRQL